MSNSALRQIPHSQFDKGFTTANKTAEIQAKFIVANYEVFKKFAAKARPQGWKINKFKSIVEKINNKQDLEMKEYSYLDEYYEAVIGLVYDVPCYKKEFYKGHQR